ncbi:MAG: ATPase, T2SS/T4P/T4SS family [Candidatus Omnitrophota bacterium]
MALSINEKICALLVKKGLVSINDLDEARRISLEKNRSLSDVLVEINAVSKQSLMSALSEGLGLPFIKLSCFQISPEILSSIPEKIAMMYRTVPISRVGRSLTVAMADPLNILALDDLKIMTNLDVSTVLAAEEDISEAIDKYYRKSADEEISNIVEEIEDAHIEAIADEDDNFSSADLLRITEEAPVVKLTNMILSRGIKDRAGDILIEPMEDRTRVRYRVDGVLVESYSPPRKFHQALVSRIKVLSDLDIAERRLPQDGRFQIKIEGRKVDFRVSVVPSSFGEKVALRVLDKQQAQTDLDMLGLKKKSIETLREVSSKPHGMVLVCGPTGCGKTTTLYSILRYVDAPGKNLVTVEDPVEYEFWGVNQVSINEDIGLTFSACLRSILRQDPDVIMVGEIRDHETLDIAIKSALTGHLVLSTLHTNTAAGAVIRMVNMGVEHFLITSSVELIAAQRLIRRLCNDCKKPFVPTEEVALKYGILDEKGAPARIFSPVGCKRCLNSGYKGRIAIMECLVLTPKVKDMIFSGAQEFEIEKAAREEGMSTLRENGMENVLEGVTSLEEVLRVTVETRSIGK